MCLISGNKLMTNIEQQLKIIEYFNFSKHKIIPNNKKYNFCILQNSIYIYSYNNSDTIIRLLNGELQGFFGGKIQKMLTIPFEDCLNFYDSYQQDPCYCFLSFGKGIKVIENFLLDIKDTVKEELFETIDKIISEEI